MHPLQEQEQAKRDREAEGYEAFFPEWRVQAEVTAVRSVILRDARAHGRLVDLGTGTGRVVRAVAQDFDSVIGVDFSPQSLREAARRLPDRLRGRVTWLRADATATGIERGSADVVTSTQLLQHLPTEELRDAAVGEAARLLRPGGLLVLTCYGFNLWNRFRGPREHVEGGLYVRRHTPGELRQRLERVLMDVSVRAFVGLPDAMPWPRLDWLMSRFPGWTLLGRTLLASGRRGSDS